MSHLRPLVEGMTNMVDKKPEATASDLAPLFYDELAKYIIIQPVTPLLVVVARTKELTETTSD